MSGTIPKIIWQLWLQGWDNAPPVVQACALTWKKHNPDWRIETLSADTLRSFIDTDELVALTAGKAVPPEVMANLVRMLLLERHGGVWADATAYCLKSLDDWLPEAAQTGLFSFQQPHPERMLVNWFLASEPDNYVVREWRRRSFEYWDGRLERDTYFWHQRLFAEAYASDDRFRAAWDRTHKVSAEGPLEYRNAATFARPLSSHDRHVITGGDVAMLKLTHRLPPATYTASSVLTYLFDRAREPVRPRCWGIGLGRTGTTSFCEALSILGYERVCHNPSFEELRDLDGGSDNGVTIFFKYLDFKFPNSKFVLTHRDLEPWLDSFDYIERRHPVTSREQDVPIMRRMMLYGSVTFDRDNHARAYARHVEEVREYFKGRPHDLLEMNMSAGDGWDALCPFLGLPVPSAPFPRAHARVDDAPLDAPLPRLVFSFVVDGDPRFAYEGWHLARSLVRYCGGDPSAIHVQCTPAVSLKTRQLFRDQGYHVHEIEPFGDGRCCNKVVQLDALQSFEFDYAVLLDTDTIAVSDLRPFLSAPAIYGKVVDAPNPPLEVLRAIAHAAGISVPPASPRPADNGKGETLPGNCNGGFYAVPKSASAKLSVEWRRWALWLLQNIDLLRATGHERHVDQVSFWLAPQSAELPFQPAPSNVNYYTHMRGAHLELDPSRPIALLHYHGVSMGPSGLLTPPEPLDPAGQAALARANDQIRAGLEDAPPLAGMTTPSAPQHVSA